MGGLIGNNQQNKKDFVKANKIIGKEIRCNTCGKEFAAHTNLNLFNNHIKNCYQINRERDRIENLLNDLREAHFEIEELEKNKLKKKENKKIIKEKPKKNKRTINHYSLNPSDLIFFNPNLIINSDNETNNNNFFSNEKENDNEICNLSELDLESLKELPFEEKLDFFRSYVKTLKVDWRKGSCTIEVDREDCFRQSLIQYEKIDPYKELKINFRGEVSHDAGGLIREWYSIIFKHLMTSETSNYIEIFF